MSDGFAISWHCCAAYVINCNFAEKNNETKHKKLKGGSIN